MATYGHACFGSFDSNDPRRSLLDFFREVVCDSNSAKETRFRYLQLKVSMSGVVKSFRVTFRNVVFNV